MNLPLTNPLKSEQTTLKYADGFRRRLQLAAQFDKRTEAAFARKAVEEAVTAWETAHPDVVKAAEDLWAKMERRAA